MDLRATRRTVSARQGLALYQPSLSAMARKVPVLLTSGYERPPDRAPFLQKPFSLAELEQAVRAALA